MIVNMADIPKGKNYNDYSEETVFELDDRPARFDRDAFKLNQIKRVRPGDPNYDYALTLEEVMNKLDKPSK